MAYAFIIFLSCLFVAIAGFKDSNNEIDGKYPANLQSTTLDVKPVNTFNFDYSKLPPQATAQMIREYIAAQLDPPQPKKEIPKQMPSHVNLSPQRAMPQGEVIPKMLQPGGGEPAMHQLQHQQQRVPQSMIAHGIPQPSHFVQPQEQFRPPQNIAEQNVLPHQHQHQQMQQVRVPQNNAMVPTTTTPTQQHGAGNPVPQSQMPLPLPNQAHQHHIDNRNLQYSAAPAAANGLYQQQLIQQTPVVAQAPLVVKEPQKPNAAVDQTQQQQSLQVLQTPAEPKFTPVQATQQHQLPIQQSVVAKEPLPVQSPQLAPIPQTIVQPTMPQTTLAVNFHHMKQLQELAALRELQAMRHQNAMTNSQLDLLVKLLSFAGKKSNLANVVETVANIPKLASSALKKKVEPIVSTINEKSVQPTKPVQETRKVPSVQQKKKEMPPTPVQEKELPPTPVRERNLQPMRKQKETTRPTEERKEVSSRIREATPAPTAPPQIFIQFIDLSPQVYRHMLGSPKSTESRVNLNESKPYPGIPDGRTFAAIANAVKTSQSSPKELPLPLSPASSRLTNLLDQQKEISEDQENDTKAPTFDKVYVESD